MSNSVTSVTSVSSVRDFKLYVLCERPKKIELTSKIITFISLFLLGVLFEIVQIYIPRRSFNPKDIAANGLGLACVYMCNKLIGRRQIKA